MLRKIQNPIKRSIITLILFFIITMGFSSVTVRSPLPNTEPNPILSQIPLRGVLI